MTLLKRTNTRRWSLWKWKQELQDSHSSQKSTADIPHFHKWKSVLLTLPHHLPHLNDTKKTPLEDSEATALYAAVWCLPALMKRALYKPVFTLWHHSTPYDSRQEQNHLYTFSITWITTTHIHKHRWSLPGCHSSRRKFYHSSTRWWLWLEDPFQIDNCVFTTLPVSYPWPYSLNLLHSTQEMCQHHTTRWWTSATSQISRCDDSYNWWRHPWSRRYLLDFEYDMD